jgi:hypothetical protein
MRWSSYDGDRIPVRGHRTFVEDRPLTRFAAMRRRYGFVWQDGAVYRGCFEVPRPGEVRDVEVGPFSSEKDSRAAVELALRTERHED